jgi:hypothetical protein
VARASGSAERSSRRELIPSFPNTLRRCHSTVRGLRNSWAPISGFVCPSAARCAICASCGVSSSSVSTVRFAHRLVAILLVIYPLIDAVASLIDGSSQHGSARRLLLANAAASAVAAVALGAAAAATVGIRSRGVRRWAALSGAAQLVVVLRRRVRFVNQWPMLLAGGFSVIAGVAYVIASTAPIRSSTRSCSTPPPAGSSSSSRPGCSRDAHVASRPLPPDPPHRPHAGAASRQRRCISSHAPPGRADQGDALARSRGVCRTLAP